MKHLLITTIVAVLLVGCGESQQSAPQAEAKPEPTTAKASGISIYKAAYNGNIEAVKQHLATGTDVNAKDFVGWTPLHHAVNGSRKETVNFLLAKGADVNVIIESGGFKGKTPLDVAKITRQYEIADLLRKHGGKHSIFGAARQGKIEAVKQHIAAGTNLEAKDGVGRASLHHAAMGGQKEITELFITNGAGLNAQDDFGETPLDMAETVYKHHSPELKAGKKETAELLRKHGGKTGEELKAAEPVVEAAKPEPPTAEAPDISIHEAAITGNIEAVKKHLAASRDVNAKDKYGSTPLLRTAREGHKEVAEMLIAKGADVNAKNNRGRTPLHRAANKGYKEIVKLLIAEGADVNAKMEDGDTPLDMAIRRKYPETADLLRKHGGKTGKELKPAEPVADSQPEPTTAKVPDIFNAAGTGNIEAVKQHVASGTDVNAKNKYGTTPLHFAAGGGHKQITELLIAKGADVNAKSNRGVTPLDWTTTPDDPIDTAETAALLRKHGGKTGEELKAEGK
jgi:ankyrin repeat protein